MASHGTTRRKGKKMEIAMQQLPPWQPIEGKPENLAGQLILPTGDIIIVDIGRPGRGRTWLVRVNGKVVAKFIKDINEAMSIAEREAIALLPEAQVIEDRRRRSHT